MTSEIVDLHLNARDRVARGLREYLNQGSYQTGESVPSERALAKQFGVSRDTVRSALKDLVRQGLIIPSRARTRRSVVGPNAPVAAVAGGVMAKTIALISDNLIAPEAYSNIPQGFEARVFTTAALCVQGAGLHVLALQAASLSGDDIRGLAEQKLGGFILLGGVAESPVGKMALEAAAELEVPTVVYGDGPSLADFDRCWSDHEAGAYALTNWLLAKGKRKIQRFWRVAEEFPWLVARNRGYERAMREAGLDPLPAIQPVPLNVTSETLENFTHVTRLLAGYLLETVTKAGSVDAFMVASDPHAFELSAALKLLGQDPAAYPIVGYDNSWQSTLCRAWAPAGPIATCDKNNPAIGHELASLLLERINRTLPAMPQRRLVHPKLIELAE